MLEAVTVCVGYGDFLAETAGWNAPLFDRWVIVTDEKDLETQEVCRRHALECLIVNEGRDESGFNKGWLIERGLQHLSANAYRLHLDADIVLPSRFRHRLDAAKLDQDAIYGCDRIMVKNWEQWQKLLASNYLINQHDYRNRLRFPEGFHVGTRWVDSAVSYVPIGFFQLWHSSQDLWRGTRTKPYPTKHNTACRTDVQHGLQWDRRRRLFLPDIIAIHLESETAKLGVNWNGRKTKRFGPDGDLSMAQASIS